MELTIESSNPSNGGKSFVTKLVSSKTIDLGILGIKETKVTYYISAPKQGVKGTKVTLDMDLFKVVEHPFEVTNDAGEIEVINLKWLHIK